MFAPMKHSSPSDSLSLFDLAPLVPDFAHEEQAILSGLFPVAGTDEAGRGPLAGPVVAAAVVLDPSHIPAGLNDSKKLSKKRREKLYDEILECADVSIATSSPRLIDELNILHASLDAMRRSVLALTKAPKLVLVDGRDVPKGLPCKGVALIKGDARSVSIAAASIVAKVTRDRMMERGGKLYPAYGFETHAGYGTPAHLAAIREHGPCPLHRMSFRPLRQDLA
jgi:ribonuclease HII